MPRRDEIRQNAGDSAEVLWSAPRPDQDGRIVYPVTVSAPARYLISYMTADEILRAYPKSKRRSRASQ